MSGILVGIIGGILFYLGIQDLPLGQAVFATVLALALTALIIEAIRSQP